MHQIRKINVLANSGVKFFTAFTDSMKEPDGKWPTEFDPLLIRPFLMANFHMARLYSKFISIKVGSDPLWYYNYKLREWIGLSGLRSHGIYTS